jgi:hypothetical protein
MKRELPDDLARLGVYLEAAAKETLRRRQRRQVMANFIGAVSLAVPFALAVAAADLSPADGLCPPRPQPISLDVQPTPNPFTVRRVADEPLPPTKKETCLDAQDCRTSIKPPAPPARVGKP